MTLLAKGIVMGIDCLLILLMSAYAPMRGEHEPEAYVALGIFLIANVAAIGL